MSCGKLSPVILLMKQARNEGVRCGHSGAPKINPYSDNAVLATTWSCGYDVGEFYSALPIENVLRSNSRDGRKPVHAL